MNVRDDKQMAEIWLSNVEKKDLELHAELKEIYSKYNKKKYLVTAFEFGERFVSGNVGLAGLQQTPLC